MAKGKMLLGLLAGAAAGAVAGILLAPGKGSETRKNLSKRGRDTVDNLKVKQVIFYTLFLINIFQVKTKKQEKVTAVCKELDQQHLILPQALHHLLIPFHRSNFQV